MEAPPLQNRKIYGKNQKMSRADIFCDLPCGAALLWQPTLQIVTGIQLD